MGEEDNADEDRWWLQWSLLWKQTRTQRVDRKVLRNTRVQYWSWAASGIMLSTCRTLVVLSNHLYHFIHHGQFIRWNFAQGLSTLPLLSSVADSHLSQILMQIQQTAVQSQRALNISRQQISSKERERRILQLTINEINSLGDDVNLYKGVGKM